MTDLAAISPDVPLPTWELLREQVDQALRRSLAWRRTGHWMIDVLQEELGESWAVDAVEQFGDLPIPVMWAVSGHMYAFVQALDLALRLRLLQFAKGAGRIRKELRGNRQLSRVLHVSLQATVAGLALGHGWDVHLEPGRPPADLWFETEGRRITVETKVLEPSVAHSRVRSARWTITHSGRPPPKHLAACTSSRLLSAAQKFGFWAAVAAQGAHSPGS